MVSVILWVDPVVVNFEIQIASFPSTVAINGIFTVRAIVMLGFEWQILLAYDPIPP
jgi:hypothetical protein